ncbi:PREDICTED: spermidine sinapoyl-CoA acyltransferase-like [Camelina sativa]|uniref:Spermidine sinapoyl-CoA acyltransferase-like n=1 Tax=Camelina sativa TaxID=90675 RepID=A0ABM0TGP3_CAMSA|nr:PREDICTED: spermidine sinapoyl-CoA acyltransferase-like [Camelina sativa]
MTSRDNSCPFVVERLEVVLVKPSKPTPDVNLSLSTIDNDPNNELILEIICVFSPNSYVQDHADHHPASLLQLALSNTLVYYYPLAGKLHRRTNDQRLQLNCKAGDGVPFIKATALCTLSSLSYLESANHLDGAYHQLVPSHDTLNGCNSGYNPLALQVTKFACGGMTIGMTYSHTVCDGVGMTQFSQALLELASGKIQPTVIPVWDRDRLTSSQISGNIGSDDKNPKLVYLEKASSSDTPTEDMVRETLNITSEDITKFKNIIMEAENDLTNKKIKKNMVITTVEVLAAYVWRARCRAMKLNPDKTTVLMISVGIRNTMDPPLPKGYYGNAFVIAFVALTAKELSETPMSRLVKLIKDAKREAVENCYLWEQLREMENTMKLKLASKEICGGEIMMMTDWRHLGMHQDVWGSLVNIIPLVPMTLAFLCILLPSSKAVPGKSGGVQMLITLPRDAMAKFKEEMDALHP